MQIRLAKDEDYTGIARLHRSTIRNLNSKDYPEDVIRVWSARSNAERFRSSASRCKRWVAIENGKIIGFCDHGDNCEVWGVIRPQRSHRKRHRLSLTQKSRRLFKKTRL